MNFRKWLVLFGTMMLGIIAAAGISIMPAAARAGKTPAGIRVNTTIAREGTYWVVMAEQADLSAAYAISGRTERARYVVDTLQTTAGNSQADIIRYLERERALGTVSAFRPFFITNAILVSSNPTVKEALAGRNDVSGQYADWTYALPEEASRPAHQPNKPLMPEWNISRVRAPEVWSVYGAQGEGVVVGTIDTGVDQNHPALAMQYRGVISASHNFNWYDATGECPPGGPCDDFGPGTTVMGVILGEDGENQIGVAPAAQWITAKACDSTGLCTGTELLSSMEWMMAPCPEGVLPGDPSCDPDRRPDVVNNSWGVLPGGTPFFQAAIDAWQAAGILPVFRAGDAGPGPSTLESPADNCGLIAVGATDMADAIINSSSRGPGLFSNCTQKPDLAAPGDMIRTAFPGGGYVFHDGTSRAAPHVAGCAALMLSVDRSLSYNDIYDALSQGALDLGPAGHDNDYGHGRLDCFAGTAIVSPLELIYIPAILK